MYNQENGGFSFPFGDIAFRVRISDPQPLGLSDGTHRYRASISVTLILTRICSFVNSILQICKK
jgi:hypothetical protein